MQLPERSSGLAELGWGERLRFLGAGAAGGQLIFPREDLTADAGRVEESFVGNRPERSAQIWPALTNALRQSGPST